ncbi:hypothetical protein OO013_10160 [Mangrovivirga sp. M17]|uniref:Uncharacterized protein n=1 Tax=Mangrovivirga halotolerans TaxID=2993936 RepID=A0ABT3RRX1_9BACT|nr:hypothetical protein [Mangrovivirga halotolerans]MCX2744231.1 hypothetical protein [Mangrovivirga halotolerans]
MPKGEHFKKDNPRIHQVSFKVNATELSSLKQILEKENMGMAEWFRHQIIQYSDNGSAVVDSKLNGRSEKTDKKEKKVKIEKPIEKVASKSENKESEKKQPVSQQDQSQMSLF